MNSIAVSEDRTLPFLGLAESRSAVYRFLAAAFDQPTPEQHDWLASADFRHSLEEVCDSFGVAVPETEIAAADAGDHEARYIACFEVGLPEPPVVLQASHYQKREPAPRIIHEHILFYQRFGVRLAPGNLNSADHLSNELAFLIRLDELLQAEPASAPSLVRARLDFLSRHAALWPAQAASAAEEKGLPTPYLVLLNLLAAAVAQDLELTRQHIDDMERRS